MKKIRLLLNFFFESEYKFTLPKKKKIIIFDEDSLYFFKDIFNHTDYYTLHIRKHIIYPTILIKSFFIHKLKWNTYKYGIEIINFIEPKIVITHNDNESFFWKIKSFVNKNVKTIFIQNGYRNYNNDVFEKVDNENFIKKDHFVDYFFTFSEDMKNKYLEYLNGQGIVLGSFRSNRVPIKKDYKNKKDILFISEFAPSNLLSSPCALERYWKPENFHLPIVKQFALDNNLKLKILGKLRRNSIYRNEEKFFFEKILGKKNWEYVESNYHHECYTKIDQSKIIVYVSSTLGYEAITRGIPTAALCTRQFAEGQKDLFFAWPSQLPNKNQFATNTHNENEVLKILNYLNDLKDGEWTDTTKNLNKYFLHFDKNNSAFYQILEELEIPHNKNDKEISSFQLAKSIKNAKRFY